jgi:hypothetical protein
MLVSRGDVGEGLHAFERADALGMQRAAEAVAMTRKMQPVS